MNIGEQVRVLEGVDITYGNKVGVIVSTHPNENAYGVKFAGDATEYTFFKEELESVEDDVINPEHYRLTNGTQVIDMIENLSFCRGNAIKYLARAGKKDKGVNELVDLKKALWYVEREIARLEK